MRLAISEYWIFLGHFIGKRGRNGTLKRANAVTLFAPENEAFAKLPGGTILSALEDVDRVMTILIYTSCRRSS